MGIGVQDVIGKFHAHVTVEADDRLADFCKGRSIKVTAIEDQRPGATRLTWMTTSYYSDEEPGAYDRTVAKLKVLASSLSQAGFSVLRSKLEHESLPTAEPFSKNNYREFHVRISLPADRVAEAREDIRKDAETADLKCFMSKNQMAGKLDQFVSFRCYDGSVRDADWRLGALLNILGGRGYNPIEVKRETAVYDTNPEMDDWFYCCMGCDGCKE
jgi:hypothetical protein